MFSMIRRVVPVLAVVGGLVTIPGVASADQSPPAGLHERSDRERLERERAERERRERVERERMERERAERERRERFERARFERERREHEAVCIDAARRDVPGWRMRELGCR